MPYYIVTVVSPAGFRDTYGVHAINPVAAKTLVTVRMAGNRPFWVVKSVMRAY